MGLKDLRTTFPGIRIVLWIFCHDTSTSLHLSFCSFCLIRIFFGYFSWDHLRDLADKKACFTRGGQFFLTNAHLYWNPSPLPAVNHVLKKKTVKNLVCFSSSHWLNSLVPFAGFVPLPWGSIFCRWLPVWDVLYAFENDHILTLEIIMLKK